MAKITNLEAKTFQGKPSGFKVTLDDGRNGNLEEKQSDKGLRIGDDVIVTEIPYTSKAGNKSTLYGLRLNGVVSTGSKPANTPVQQPTPQPQPQAQRASAPITGGRTIQDIKAGATIKAMELVVNAVLEHEIPWEKVSEKHKELSGLLYAAIDEISQG